LNGRRGIPYVIVGEPGTAKTSIVNSLARQGGLHFEGVLNSLRSPLDYLGVPVPKRMKLTSVDQHLSPDGDEEFMTMNYAPAGFSVRAAQAKRSLIFFDEANTAPKAVQAAMLRVLLEGVVGELQLPPEVRFLLAMNHTDDAAGGQELSPALANRMGWLEWEKPEVKNFVGYLTGGGSQESDPIIPAQLEAEVDAVWEAEAWPHASGMVAGFLTARSDLLHKKPEKGDRARAWPSARTWEFAAHAYAGSEIFKLSAEATNTAVSGFIGNGAYAEFFNWVQTADLPNPADLLDGKVQFKHDKRRLDRTAAVLASATALVLPAGSENRNDRIGRLWDILTPMSTDAVDVIMPCVTSLCKARAATGYRSAMQLLGKMEAVLSAAGIQAT
jgi:hypothetical protein